MARRPNTISAREFNRDVSAATAQVHDLTMVTRNVADFAPMGIAVLTPGTDRYPVASPSRITS